MLPFHERGKRRCALRKRRCALHQRRPRCASGLIVRVVALSMPLLSSCVLLTDEPRALLLQPDSSIRVEGLPCNAPELAERISALPARPATTLDPDAIRVITWNI